MYVKQNLQYVILVFSIPEAVSSTDIVQDYIGIICYWVIVIFSKRGANEEVCMARAFV